MYMIEVSLHILAAVVLIGHMLFWTTVVGSITKQFDPPQSEQMLRQIIQRSSWISWACLFVLITSGIFMLSDWQVTLQRVTSGELFVGRFGQVLGAKLFGVTVIIIGCFFLGVRTLGLWRFNLFVGLMVIFLSVLSLR